MRTNFRKYERLCSKKYIENLFKKGESFVVYPLRIYLTTAHPVAYTGVQVVFAVPQRNFRKATQRNLLRRRVRESYRNNKQIISNLLYSTHFTIHIGFLYIAKEIENYSSIEEAMIKSLQLIAEKYKNSPIEEK